MADRRDRSATVHMRDGVLRKGKILGRCDADGRVREADGRFRKGDELGTIDEKLRVRRKAVLVGRGEIVGRIKGNAIYGRPGVLEGAKKLGYVDAQGDVVQCDCAAFRGRVVGKARGKRPECALAYFLLKFQPLEDHVDALEKKVEASADKFAFVGRIRALLKVLPEVDAIGDFDALFSRLEQLEATCATQLGEHLEREGEIAPGLREEVDRVRRDPEYGAEELWDRVRSTVASLMEHRDLTSAMMGRVPMGIPANGQLLPPPMPGSVSIAPLALPAPAEAPPVPRSREQLERLLDTQAATQVFSAIDGAIEGLEALRRARDGGLRSLRDAVDEGALGLRAIAKAREDGVAGIRAALERLVASREPTPPPPET